MKAACGCVVIALTLTVVLAGPLQQLTLGEMVKLALREKGIPMELLSQAKADFKVGDIWSDCGKSYCWVFQKFFSSWFSDSYNNIAPLIWLSVLAAGYLC